jgi:hypothetical protein
MVSSSFVKASLECLEFGMLLSTSILVFGPTNTKSKKGKNFVVEEDYEFCKSYFHILQKCVTCTGQKLTTFWCNV